MGRSHPYLQMCQKKRQKSFNFYKILLYLIIAAERLISNILNSISSTAKLILAHLQYLEKNNPIFTLLLRNLVFQNSFFSHRVTLIYARNMQEIPHSGRVDRIIFT